MKFVLDANCDSFDCLACRTCSNDLFHWFQKLKVIPVAAFKNFSFDPQLDLATTAGSVVSSFGRTHAG